MDWSGCPVVTRDDDTLSGAWRVRGTRIPVDAVIQNADQGIDALTTSFVGLTADVAEAIIAYYWQHEG